jgi:hypothetical protein
VAVPEIMKGHFLKPNSLSEPREIGYEGVGRAQRPILSRANQSVIEIDLSQRFLSSLPDLLGAAGELRR